MARVTPEYAFDLRQQRVIAQSLKPETIKNRNILLIAAVPCDSLAVLGNWVASFYTSTQYSTQSLIIESQHDWFMTAISLRLNLTNLIFFVDSCIVQSAKDNINVVAYYSDYLHANNITIFSQLDETSALSSQSSVFVSANWVEREARESSGVTYYGLTDSRRLLTDYVSLLSSPSSYTMTRYDLTTQCLYN